jgi:hypothetical protein
MVKVRRATRRMTHKRRKTRGRKKVMRGGGCREECITHNKNGTYTTYDEHSYVDDKPPFCGRCQRTRDESKKWKCFEGVDHVFVREIWCYRCACSYRVYAN